MFLTSTITMLITYVVWTGLQSTYEKQVDATGEGNPHIAKGVLAMIFLYSLAFNIGWTPLQVTYVVEILPYNLRARVSYSLLSHQFHPIPFHSNPPNSPPATMR